MEEVQTPALREEIKIIINQKCQKRIQIQDSADPNST